MRKTPRRPKKFRFHITSNFIINSFAPCRVADVSGGKGILSFLLSQAGFDPVVIDPAKQELPRKIRRNAYDKSLGAFKPSELDNKSIERVVDIFHPEMVRDVELVVALHGHGCMIDIIEQCAIYNKPFVILPCCVVDEPIDKPQGINWKDFVYQQAIEVYKPTDIQTINLDFVGNSFAIYKE